MLAPTRFPAGLPLLLAPFSHSAAAMHAVTMAAGLALVAVVWLCARTLGGWRSALAAGALMLLSPGLIVAGKPIMADAVAAALTVGALLALLRGRDRTAGVLIGLSAWMRLVHAAFVTVIPRRARMAGLAIVGALIVWQLAIKGSLLGYNSQQASFGMGHVFGASWYEMSGNPSSAPNAEFFPAVLAGAKAHYFTPLVVLGAAVGCWRFRALRATRIALAFVAINLAVYLPYYFQSARFMLPAGSVLVVFAAAAVAPSDLWSASTVIGQEARQFA